MRLGSSVNATAARRRRPAPFVVALLLAACAGGGGDGEPVPPDDRVIVDIGAPQAALAQSPLNIEVLAAPTGAAQRRPLAAAAESFDFPTGPDEDGRRLPQIGGIFDPLTQQYDGDLGSRFWLDLPASAGAYKVALIVASIIQGTGATVGGAPTAGELWITPREAYADLPGRIRLRFAAGATPVCVAWDREADGTVEAETCTTFAALAAWWQAPQGTLALPLAVQRVAAASYAGWMRLYAQFDIGVGALQMAETHRDALLAAAAGAAAVTLDCSVPAPATAAGRLVLRWLDRNASGRFDTGDDVRFEAAGCWNRLDETGGAGRRFDGAFELRGHERGVGAAPTFLALTITDTEDIGGVVTDLASVRAEGGFTLHAPGIDGNGLEVTAYPFSADNLVAAGTVAARSIDFYPDVADLAYPLLDAARTDTIARDLGLCRNDGQSAFAYSDGAAPAGLSPGDTVTLTLTGCDIGNALHARLVDGTIALTVQALLPGTAPDWEIRADARIDLLRSDARGTLQRRGEFGLSVAFVLGHSMQVGFRPEGYGSASALDGVLSGIENGALAYRIGCFAANYFRGTWADSDYQVLPNQVVRTANRVFTIGMRQGESFLFRHAADGSVYADIGLAGLLPISAPECVPLGVPASGVSGVDTTMQFDTGPGGDGDRVRLGLYDRSGVLLHETTSSWQALGR